MKKIFLLCLLFLLVSSNGWGATYYVDSGITDTNVASATPDCVNYSPTLFSCGAGADNAYKTIADVNAKTFSAGDFVYLRKGQTWAENMTVKSDGAAGNYITYGAFGSGANPIIMGRIRIRSGYTPAGSYTILQDIDIVNSTDRGIEFGGHDHLILRRLNVTGSTSNGIEARSESGNLSDDVLIEDVNIYNGSSYGIWGPFGESGVIRRVIAHNNGTIHNQISVLPSGTSTLLLEDVEAYGSGATANGFGTSVTDVGQTVIYRRCKSHDNASAGFIGHGEAAGTIKYEFCTAYSNDGSGIIIGDNIASNAPAGIVRNCLVADNGGTGLVFNTTGATEARNNIVWGNGTYEIEHKTSVHISDYNLVDISGAFDVVENGSGITWAAWLALPGGYDVHSINSDPILNADYTLQSTSPAISTGTRADKIDLTGDQTDGFDNAYYFAPLDKLNIGADQNYSDAQVKHGARSFFHPIYQMHMAD